MGVFRNTFLSFGEGSCDPAKWRSHFLEYSPEEWKVEGGGVLQYHSDEGKEYALIIVHWADSAFILQLACRNLSTNRFDWCKFALASMDKLDQFEQQDDLCYPAGCLHTASEAWLVVEDFLDQPQHPSDRTQWVDDAAIPWPEL